MRRLAIVAVFAVATPTLGADKDEDKAKEVAVAFMKAVKAKDIDAVMKVVEVPFLVGVRDNKIAKTTDDLKADLQGLLDEVRDAERVPTEVTEVLDLPAIRKKLAEAKDDEVLKPFVKGLGDKAHGVKLKKPLLLIRIKDGRAKVVGIAP